MTKKKNLPAIQTEIVKDAIPSKGAIVNQGSMVAEVGGEKPKTALIVREENLSGLPSTELVDNMLECVRRTEIMTPEQGKFLIENKERLQNIMTRTFIWRTRAQKLGILSDGFHPTLHSKFHQAILENNVFFGQVIGLAKDAEMLRFEVEELKLTIDECDEEILKLRDKEEGFSVAARRLEIKKGKTQVELQHNF